MFENIRSDLRAHGGNWGAQGFWALVVYRFGRWRTMHMIQDRPAAGEPPDTGLGVPRQRANMTPETPNG